MVLDVVDPSDYTNHQVKAFPLTGRCRSQGREGHRIVSGLFIAMITKERLDELLTYDPETGVFTWKVQASSSARFGSVAGRPNASGHIQIQIDGKRYLAHRLAFLTMTGCWPENEVDHINGNPADNRWSNLRPATRLENGRNRRTSTRNTSGVPGVCWYAASGKWLASITAARKQIHLGYFAEFEDAVAARRAAELEHFGEFSATASRP